MNQPWTIRLQEEQSIFQVNTQVEVAESMNQPICKKSQLTYHGLLISSDVLDDAERDSAAGAV
jgi:hypothetical protein